MGSTKHSPATPSMHSRVPSPQLFVQLWVVGGTTHSVHTSASQWRIPVPQTSSHLASRGGTSQSDQKPSRHSEIPSPQTPLQTATSPSEGQGSPPRRGVRIPQDWIPKVPRRAHASSAPLIALLPRCERFDRSIFQGSSSDVASALLSDRPAPLSRVLRRGYPSFSCSLRYLEQRLPFRVRPR